MCQCNIKIKITFKLQTMLQDQTVGMITPKAISSIMFCEAFPDFFLMNL